MRQHFENLFGNKGKLLAHNVDTTFSPPTWIFEENLDILAFSPPTCVFEESLNILALIVDDTVTKEYV